MKKHLIRMAIMGLVVVLVGLGATWLVSGNARAALGNQGVPVRCYTSSAGVAPGGDIFLTCVPAAPPGFVSSQRVPTGYYFLVTDVMVTPQASTTTAERVDFYLFDAYGTNSRSSSYHFRSVDGASSGQHFSVPLYTLTADHRLEVQAFNANDVGFDIYVTGLLVNNVNYLPLVLEH
jgi:hypothetical protein